MVHVYLLILFKEVHCGVGPFLLCIIEDHSPKHEFRETTKGKRLVNINTFDSKQAYRMWTGGGHKIHATDTEDESLHDFDTFTWKKFINT